MKKESALVKLLDAEASCVCVADDAGEHRGRGV